ncbi:MAG: MAPEG family protein, partial [Gammaproteobacteria bacterium]|nr:MAPEG family protein [Gammaproteobacteria bacterium]
RPRDIALGQRNWPKSVQQVSNAFNNQWESPTLFYAGVAFAMLAGAGGGLLVGLAWLYVATRVVHALIYVTTNTIPLRFAVFIAGFAALAVFWGALAAQALG